MSYASLPHLRGNAASRAAAPAPKVAAGAGAGTGATATVSGADERGVVTVVTAGTPAAGTVATITFANAYSAAPDAVIVSAGDSATATVGGFYASATATALTIGTHGTPAGTLKIHYVVVGGA